MNCYRVQALLSAYIDHELDVDEQRALRGHLFNCQACEKEYRALVILKQAMGSLYAPQPPTNTVVLFKQQLAGTMACTYDKHMPVFLFRHAVMTAACFGLFFATSLWLFPNNSLPMKENLVSNKSSIQNTTISETLPSPVQTMKKTAAAANQNSESLSDNSEPDIKHPRVNENNIFDSSIIGVPVSK